VPTTACKGAAGRVQPSETYPPIQAHGRSTEHRARTSRERPVRKHHTARTCVVGRTLKSARSSRLSARVDVATGAAVVTPSIGGLRSSGPGGQGSAARALCLAAASHVQGGSSARSCAGRTGSRAGAGSRCS
jgi:hypothetical protein